MKTKLRAFLYIGIIFLFANNNALGKSVYGKYKVYAIELMQTWNEETMKKHFDFHVLAINAIVPSSSSAWVWCSVWHFAIMCAHYDMIKIQMVCIGRKLRQLNTMQSRKRAKKERSGIVMLKWRYELCVIQPQFSKYNGKALNLVDISYYKIKSRSFTFSNIPVSHTSTHKQKRKKRLLLLQVSELYGSLTKSFHSQFPSF